MMTEVSRATSHIMMEVGGATSCIMKVCGATKSTLKYVSRCEVVYFMMTRKLLHRMKEVCGATSNMMKDELIVGEHQVDGTRLLYIDVNIFFAILASQVRSCTYLASLLQCIGQNICRLAYTWVNTQRS